MTTLSGLAPARSGFVRGRPRRLGDLLVRVVFAQVVEHLDGVGVVAAGHALEQHLLAASGDGLTEADREVVRVGELLVDVETGEVLAESDTVRRMAADAEDLARRSPL